MSGRVSGTKAEIRNGSGLGLQDANWQNSSIFSGLFQGTCRLVAKRSIGSQFLEISLHKDFALTE